MCAVMAIGIVNSNAKKTIQTATKPRISPPTIVIDAGHGGFDGGAVADDGTEEKDINLNISLKLDKVLKLYGFKTLLTRTEDTALGTANDSGTTKQNDLAERVKIMNSQTDALVISIHQNKFEQADVKGLQVFYNSKTANAKELGEAIQGYVNDNLQEEKPRVAKADTRGVHILEKSVNPAVIVECGFLSNPEDLKKLKNDEFCYTLCYNIANGIINYIQGEENGSKD